MRPLASISPAGKHSPPLCILVDQRRPFGTSSDGFFEKKLTGSNLNPAVVALITGHSSGRGTCVIPKVYQATTSWRSRERLASVHAGRPSPGALWFG